MKHVLSRQEPAFLGDEASGVLTGSTAHAAQPRTAERVDLRNRTAACAAGVLTGCRVGAAPGAPSR